MKTFFFYIQNSIHKCKVIFWREEKYPKHDEISNHILSTLWTFITRSHQSRVGLTLENVLLLPVPFVLMVTTFFVHSSHHVYKDISKITFHVVSRCSLACCFESQFFFICLWLWITLAFFLYWFSWLMIIQVVVRFLLSVANLTQKELRVLLL